MGQHGQRDMPIPALPVAYLVVIQSAFTLRGFEGLLYLPALSGHSDQSFNRVVAVGGMTQIVGAFWLLFDAAPHQKRPRPTILFRQWHKRPVVEPFALAAEAGGKALPFRCGQAPCNRVYPMLHKILLPQALILSHGQHVGHLSPFYYYSCRSRIPEGAGGFSPRKER